MAATEPRRWTLPMSKLRAAPAPGVANMRSSHSGRCGRMMPPSSTRSPGARALMPVGRGQHPAVLLGTPLEGPLPVGLVDDLPVVDRRPGVRGDLARHAAELPVVGGGTASMLRPAAGTAGYPRGRIQQDGQHTHPVTAREEGHLVQPTPVRAGSGTALVALEDIVQLHVNTDVVRTERRRLVEDPLLHLEGRAAGVHHGVGGDRRSGRGVRRGYDRPRRKKQGEQGRQEETSGRCNAFTLRAPP